MAPCQSLRNYFGRGWGTSGILFFLKTIGKKYNKYVCVGGGGGKGNDTPTRPVLTSLLAPNRKEVST